MATKKKLTKYSRLRKAELIALLRGRKKPYSDGKCVGNKICNPKSGRCVSKTGKIGRAILGSGKSSRPEKFKLVPWFIFTMKGCNYCEFAKKLLDERNIKYQTTEINDSNKDKIYSYTDPYTKKYRYFPMIFNNGKFVGGFGELKKMIKAIH